MARPLRSQALVLHRCILLNAPSALPTHTNMSSLALARLRQGQGRCAQQLLSLVQWHQQQSAAAAAGGAQRGLADQTAAVQFAKERKGFENSLGELRKQWAKERQEREAAKAAAEAEARCAAAARRRRRLHLTACCGCGCSCCLLCFWVVLAALRAGLKASTRSQHVQALFGRRPTAPLTCAPCP